MNRRNLVTLVSVVALTVNLNAASLTGVDRTIEYSERTREYRLYVPSGLDREKPAPLVFALHGGGGNAARVEGRVAYNEFAERDGWIVVYPNGIDGHWNDLRGYEGFVSHRENVDDVGLIETILRKLNTEFSVDEKRVFVTGGSNGGLMSHTLAAGGLEGVMLQRFDPTLPAGIFRTATCNPQGCRWTAHLRRRQTAQTAPNGRSTNTDAPDFAAS